MMTWSTVASAGVTPYLVRLAANIFIKRTSSKRTLNPSDA